MSDGEVGDLGAEGRPTVTIAGYKAARDALLALPFEERRGRIENLDRVWFPGVLEARPGVDEWRLLSRPRLWRWIIHHIQVGLLFERNAEALKPEIKDAAPIYREALEVACCCLITLEVSWASKVRGPKGLTAAEVRRRLNAIARRLERDEGAELRSPDDQAGAVQDLPAFAERLRIEGKPLLGRIVEGLTLKSVMEPAEIKAAWGGTCPDPNTMSRACGRINREAIRAKLTFRVAVRKPAIVRLDT